MDNSLVSIVLCTYNGARFIEEQLDSVLNQTHQNLEIIILDDGSTDGTRRLLTEYAEKDSRIRLHFNSENLGYIKNFEKGLKLCTGDFIALCDQDDWWLPQKIQKSLILIDDSDAVYCDSDFTDAQLKSTGKKMSDEKNMYSGNDFRPFLLTNCVSGHAMLFRKNLLDDVGKMSRVVPHDWWIAITAASRNGIKYLDKPLIKYRKHDNNVILGGGKKQTSKEKQEFRKQRTVSLCQQIEKTDTHHIAKKLSIAYGGKSISSRISRIKLAYSHFDMLFYIFETTSLSKFWLPLSLFFKLK